MARKRAKQVALPGEPVPRGTHVWVVFNRGGEISRYPGVYMGKVSRYGLMHFVANKPRGRVGWCVDYDQIEIQAS